MPVKFIRVDNAAFGRKRRAVTRIKGQIFIIIVQVIGKVGFVPLDVARQLARIGINQQLVRVKPVSVFRIVRAINPVAVQRPRPQAWYLAMPHLMGVLRQRQPGNFLRTALIVQAQLHALGVRGEQGKVHPFTIKVGPQLVA